MDKVTKRVFIVLIILIIGSIAMTYDRTIIRKDYIAFPPEPEEETVTLDEGVLPESSSSVETTLTEDSTSTPL